MTETHIHADTMYTLALSQLTELYVLIQNTLSNSQRLCWQ